MNKFSRMRQHPAKDVMKRSVPINRLVLTSSISVRTLVSLVSGLALLPGSIFPALAAPPRSPDQTVACEMLVVGGGLAGAATAYEGLLAGRTVCLTEITDWVGGQISAQGTSALDERPTQRSRLFYSRGYLELRQRLQRHYGKLNPGKCWVSEACFLPGDGHKLLFEMLQDAAKRGKGTLKWYPNTVVKELEVTPIGSGQQIQGAVAIQHRPAPGQSPLNTAPLSQTIADSYRYENSPRLTKTILRFSPLQAAKAGQPSPTLPKWYVIDATETGELVALADVPYRLGIDPLSDREPSSSSQTGDPYCTQGFTYPFAMEATNQPQLHPMPAFYPRYASYYSYEAARFNFPIVFTYRRIWSPNSDQVDLNNPAAVVKFSGQNVPAPTPGDLSMQNWTWGNDYRPGTSTDNLVYTQDQLRAAGQLQPGQWMGGLRVDSLREAEELSQGFFYWLVAGTTDSQLGDRVKQPHPNNRYLTGLNSPMGTGHGLSKYPYIREGRRILGRPAWGHPQGFSITEIDISRRNYRDSYYQTTLPPAMYRSLQAALAGLEASTVIRGSKPLAEVKQRSRSTIYPDAIGIGHYAIDFHPCMNQSPPQLPEIPSGPGSVGEQGKPIHFKFRCGR